MPAPPVSHTTDDLVFLWDPNVPLEVDPIELPQLDLVSNITGDCTHIYATGQPLGQRLYPYLPTGQLWGRDCTQSTPQVSHSVRDCACTHTYDTGQLFGQKLPTSAPQASGVDTDL